MLKARWPKTLDHYSQTALSQRARLFMDFLAERLPGRYVSA